MVALIRLLGILPLWANYGIAWFVYVAAFHVMRWRRPLAASNIASAFPEKTPGERARILRESYRNLSDTLFEGIWGFRASGEELSRRVVIENPELVLHYAALKQSIVILTGHICNWEWLLLACGAQLGFPIDAIYKPLRLKNVDHFVREARARFGGNPIPAKSFLFELMKRAGQPRAYAMLADQTPPKKADKIWRTFLNRDTAFFLGPERIAKFLEAPVVYVAMRRVRRGHYIVRFHTLADPPYDELGAELVERYAAMLESEIRLSPPDWLWLHNKWKYPKPAGE